MRGSCLQGSFSTAMSCRARKNSQRDPPAQSSTSKGCRIQLCAKWREMQWMYRLLEASCFAVPCLLTKFNAHSTSRAHWHSVVLVVFCHWSLSDLNGVNYEHLIRWFCQWTTFWQNFVYAKQNCVWHPLPTSQVKPSVCLQDQPNFLTADFGVLSLKKVFFAMKRASPGESKPWYDMIMKAVENLRPKTGSWSLASSRFWCVPVGCFHQACNAIDCLSIFVHCICPWIFLMAPVT